MPYESSVYLICSSVSITLTITIAFLFWQRRSAEGARAVALMMISAAEWTLSDLLSVLSESINLKLFWNSLAYLGVVAIPALWLVFSIQFTGNRKYQTRKSLFLIFIFPCLDIIFIWTNRFHHMFETKDVFAKAGLLSIIVPSYGFLFWLHVALSYSLILSGMVIIFKNMLHKPKIYRNQSLVMILAVIYPSIGSVLYSVNALPSYPVDPTMFSFSVSGIIIFWGMFKFKLFNLVPVARAAVIESMDELVMVLDNQNVIIDVNSAALQKLNMSSEDLIGQSIHKLLKDAPSIFNKYLDVESTNEKISITEDGKIKFYDLTITSLFSIRNKVNGRYILMRDITVLEEALMNSESSRKAAEEASKAKSQFLATMSHEIRTPLNGIIGMSELLTSADLKEEEKGFLINIETSANLLLDIINDILDFSKIEAGKMELEQRSINIKELAEMSVKLFQYKASEKKLNLLLDVDEDIPNNLIGDPIRLRQILVNLIGNSLKFTESGHVEISIRKLSRKNHSVNLKFSVRDTGIGIPEDKIDSLFRSFQQADNSTTRKYGGTGLGLAIVKSLVTMMGGSMGVESTPGKGSSFSFIIPFMIDDGKKAEKYQPGVNSDFTDRNIRVLLAEDNKVNQIYMLKLFEKKKIKADLAENGMIVLQKLSQNHYDLILMDIQMPEMDGYEAAFAIRKSEASTGGHIPIIALTANATEEDRNKCLQFGMDDYIPKPVKSEKLFSSIRKLLN